MKIRVIDLHHDTEGRPVIGDDRQPKVNHSAYVFLGKSYKPGEFLDLPDDVAAKELAICGTRKRPEDDYLLLGSIEKVEDYEARTKAAAARAQSAVADHDELARRTKDLEAQVAASQQQRQMIADRDRELAQRKDAEAAAAAKAEFEMAAMRAEMDRMRAEMEALRSPAPAAETEAPTTSRKPR